MASMYRLCIFLLFLFFSLTNMAFAEKADTTKVPINFSGYALVTNKGISSIPNLTLGKPAAIFFMSVGNRLRFEPEFRMGLDGKPWMFIFWWRYDFINSDKFLLKLRANPTVVFKTVPVTNNAVQDNIIRTNRTLTGDLIASYFPSKNIGLSTYYMYVYGVEKDAVKNTHYLALRTAFSNLKLTKQLFVGINPSVYYLRMAKNQGFYSNLTMTLAKRNFPISVSTILNKTIHTQIPIGENFLWNVSLVYSFNNRYMKL